MTVPHASSSRLGVPRADTLPKTGYAYGAISTLLVGGAAAAASFGIVRALEGKDA